MILLVGAAGAAGWFANSSRPYWSNNLPPAHPHLDVVVESPEMADQAYLAQWARETSRRFNDAVMVMGHGTDFQGRWYLLRGGPFSPYHPPILMTEYIAELRKTWGDRKIVIVSCNPGHERLPPSVGDVVYSLDSIWLTPTSVVAGRADEPEPTSGNIFEFVLTRP